MIAHWFKMMWNRKKQNFLVILEMFIAFLVLCALFVYASELYVNYQRPLGFQYENVWTIEIDPKQTAEFKWTPAVNDRLNSLRSALKQLEGVEEVAGVDLLPFSFSTWNDSDSIPSTGTRYSIERCAVTDDFLKTMGLEVTRGRWYEPGDDALNYAPVVVNELFVEKMFAPGEDPIGKPVLPQFPETLAEENLARRQAIGIREQRIVGVVSNFRKNGALEKQDLFAFRRTTFADTVMSSPPQNFVIKVNPSAMSGDFEEKLINTLTPIAPDWVFTTGTLKRLNDTRMRNTLTPLVSFGVVAGFLVLMVGLGLVGVVWQHVTARTAEFGLRRALGASAIQIFYQIMGELLLLATASILVGSLVAWQFPLLNIVQDISTEIYLYGWLLAIALIYLVTLVCGLYPSLLATRVQPTEALNDE